MKAGVGETNVVPLQIDPSVLLLFLDESKVPYRRGILRKDSVFTAHRDRAIIGAQINLSGT